MLFQNVRTATQAEAHAAVLYQAKKGSLAHLSS